MDQDVSVRVTLQAKVVWNMHPAKNQSSANHQTMRIITKAYPNHLLSSKFQVQG
jgi:hypothetical protein